MPGQVVPKAALQETSRRNAFQQYAVVMKNARARLTSATSSVAGRLVKVILLNIFSSYETTLGVQYPVWGLPVLK